MTSMKRDNFPINLFKVDDDDKNGDFSYCSEKVLEGFFCCLETAENSTHKP